MSEREPLLRVNLREMLDGHTRRSNGVVKHTIMGMVVGAGIIGMESVKTGRKVVESSGRLGLKAAAVVFIRNGHS